MMIDRVMTPPTRPDREWIEREMVRYGLGEWIVRPDPEATGEKTRKTPGPLADDVGVIARPWGLLPMAPCHAATHPPVDTTAIVTAEPSEQAEPVVLDWLDDGVKWQSGVNMA